MGKLLNVELDFDKIPMATLDRYFKNRTTRTPTDTNRQTQAVVPPQTVVQQPVLIADSQQKEKLEDENIINETKIPEGKTGK